MAKEGVDGSSGKSNVNPAVRATQERGPWSKTHFEDDDDPLLVLCDEPEPQQSAKRLVFDFSVPAGKTRGDLGATGDISNDNSVTGGTVSRAVGHEECSTATGARRLSHDIGQGRDSVEKLVNVANGGEFLSYGDPTFLNTNLPFTFPQRSIMDIQGNHDNSTASNELSFPRASDATNTTDTEPTQSQRSFHIENARPSPRAGGNNRWSNNRRTDLNDTDSVVIAMQTRAEIPDVAMRQPLLGSQQQSRTDGHTSTATGERLSTTSNTESSVSGVIIDYTHDGDHLTHTPRGTRVVMLDTLSPSGREQRGEVGGAGVMGDILHEAVVEDIHCHLGTSHHKMNDTLARRQLLIVLVLCVLFMIGETVGGVLANSLALFTDVLHLASDLISYGISLLALYLSKKKATHRMTFGYHRAEVLGALFSVFVIWLVSGVLCYIAVERIIHKHYKDVKADEMLITASLGVVFNLIMGFVLHSEKCCGDAKNHAKFGHGHSHSHNSHGQGHHENGSHCEYKLLDVARDEEDDEDLRAVHRHKNINVRAAFIHVVGDIIQSLGVLVAALIIKFKEDEKYRLADPICTFFFSLLVLFTTISVLKDTLRIIMEGAPQGVDFEHLKSVLMSLDAVVMVHNLNVWALTMDRNALSVHLAIDNSRSSNEVLWEATRMLKRHHFYHLTIQVEPYNHDIMSQCLDCQLPVK